MERLKVIFAGCFLFFLSFKSNSQTVDSKSNGVTMLKEFYTEYSKIGFTVDDKKKRNVILKKYCVLKLVKEAGEWGKDGHDLLTADWGMDKGSLASLKVTHSKDSNYRISYIMESFPVSPNTPVKQNVVLDVSLIKENGELKINSVKDLTKARRTN
jgi:hypothetical protein